MQLADDDPFGPVDDKSSFFGHQRYGAEINFLFLDVPNVGDTGFGINVVNHQTDRDTHRYLVGHSPVDAFFDTVFDFSKTV